MEEAPEHWGRQTKTEPEEHATITAVDESPTGSTGKAGKKQEEPVGASTQASPVMVPEFFGVVCSCWRCVVNKHYAALETVAHPDYLPLETEIKHTVLKSLGDGPLLPCELMLRTNCLMGDMDENKFAKMVASCVRALCSQELVATIDAKEGGKALVLRS